MIPRISDTLHVLSRLLHSANWDSRIASSAPSAVLQVLLAATTTHGAWLQITPHSNQTDVRRRGDILPAPDRDGRVLLVLVQRSRHDRQALQTVARPWAVAQLALRGCGLGRRHLPGCAALAVCALRPGRRALSKLEEGHRVARRAAQDPDLGTCEEPPASPIEHAHALMPPLRLCPQSFTAQPGLRSSLGSGPLLPLSMSPAPPQPLQRRGSTQLLWPQAPVGTKRGRREGQKTRPASRPTGLSQPPSSTQRNRDVDAGERRNHCHMYCSTTRLEDGAGRASDGRGAEEIADSWRGAAAQRCQCHDSCQELAVS